MFLKTSCYKDNLNIDPFFAANFIVCKVIMFVHVYVMYNDFIENAELIIDTNLEKKKIISNLNTSLLQ